MSMHIKILICVIGVICGIIFGEVSSYATEVGLFSFILGCSQIIMYSVERKRKRSDEAYSIITSFSFSLLFSIFFFSLFLGILRMQMVQEKLHFVCESVCTYSAKIISSPEMEDEYQVLTVSLETNDEIYDIRIRTNLYPEYRVGEVLELTGKVTIPHNNFPHKVKENKNHTFDYVAYLRTKNIGSEMIYPKIEIKNKEINSFKEWLIIWKGNCIYQINKNVSQPASSLASGILFGVTKISQELLQTFRVSGLSHIIVLSGFNIVIVISSTLFVLRFLPLLLRIMIASFATVIFVSMVGGTPSIIRATLMAFIALLAMFVGRVYVAKQALIISLLFIIMYEPYGLLHDVSLHLSFLATMGLLYFSEPFELFFRKYFLQIKFLRPLQEFFVITFSAYLATLPYVMYTFGTVSVYGIMANIFIVPLVPLAMLLTFLVVITSYFSNLLSFSFGFLDSLLLNCIIWVARSIEQLPFSLVSVTISGVKMFLVYIVIFSCIKYISMKHNNETRVTQSKGNISDVIAY